MLWLGMRGEKAGVGKWSRTPPPPPKGGTDYVEDLSKDQNIKFIN